jgi:hypothetical protein
MMPNMMPRVGRGRPTCSTTPATATWAGRCRPSPLDSIRSGGRIVLMGEHTVAWNDREDLSFYRQTLPLHANGMRLSAWDASGALLAERTYYSVGGGFVVSEEVAADGSRQKAIAPDATELPIPFRTGDELLQRCQEHGLSIAGVMRPTNATGAATRRARRPAAHLGRDAGLRGARLQHRWRAARRLQGQAPRAPAAPRPDRPPGEGADRPAGRCWTG